MYMYMHLVYVEARRSVGSSETGHSDDCELPCVCVCVCVLETKPGFSKSNKCS